MKTPDNAISLEDLHKHCNDLLSQYKQSKGYITANGESTKDSSEELDYLYQIISRLMSAIYSLEGLIYQKFENHMEGHLPPIAGAGKMQNALNVLGLDDDYNVYKRTVYATTMTQKGSVVELSMEPKDKN